MYGRYSTNTSRSEDSAAYYYYYYALPTLIVLVLVSQKELILVTRKGQAKAAFRRPRQRGVFKYPLLLLVPILLLLVVLTIISTGISRKWLGLMNGRELYRAQWKSLKQLINNKPSFSFNCMQKFFNCPTTMKILVCLHYINVKKTKPFQPTLIHLITLSPRHFSLQSPNCQTRNFPPRNGDASDVAFPSIRLIHHPHIIITIVSVKEIVIFI